MSIDKKVETSGWNNSSFSEIRGKMDEYVSPSVGNEPEPHKRRHNKHECKRNHLKAHEYVRFKPAFADRPEFKGMGVEEYYKARCDANKDKDVLSRQYGCMEWWECVNCGHQEMDFGPSGFPHNKRITIRLGDKDKRNPPVKEG